MREKIFLYARAAARHAPCWAGRADAFAGRLGPVVIVLLAACYYAAYFANGLNLGGEGGTAAVLAMRLMEGQRPVVDTFLGYNVMWFMPLVWIFQWTGPDYLAMRTFFFVLCTVNALLGWIVVWRVSRSGFLALGTAVLLVLIPGMMFRNYMGFMGVANQCALLAAFVLPVRSSARRIGLIGLSGAVLGLTFLLRVEVGLFMTVIWLGLLLLNVVVPGKGWKVGLKESVAGAALGLAALVALHLPFALDSHRRGYAPQFYGQYVDFIALFRWELHKAAEEAKARRAAAHAAREAAAQAALESPANASAEAPPTPTSAVNDGRRPRVAVSDIFSEPKARDRFFAAALYLPAGLAPLLAVGAALGALVALARRDPQLWADSLVVGVTVGCALTLFPQFFFFRPDTPHISEFMVAFLPALACAVAVVVRRAADSRLQDRPLAWVVAGAVVVLVVLQVWVHWGHAWPKESAGTLAARKHGPAEFRGQNNVHVRLRPDHAQNLQALHDVIIAHSQPGDWVICLPYSPTINFMTDRPSYLRDLYTDNTMAGPRFDHEHIELAQQRQPAVFVIDHRAINNTEASRFPNWAPIFYEYLRENYDRAGEFLGNEVFVRRVNGEGSP